jgi:hypothetical protein
VRALFVIAAAHAISAAMPEDLRCLTMAVTYACCGAACASAERWHLAHGPAV